MNKSEKFDIDVIATVKSPYKEKFAVPRQPGLAPSVVSTLCFYPPFSSPDCFIGLEQFSHLWVVFQFHENIVSGWQNKVRPPRLGGNEKLGVFATRSTFRPNGLGMSVGRVMRHYPKGQNYYVEVSGLDLIDGTPVVDIKPYIAYADAVEGAQSGYAQLPPQHLDVKFSDAAQESLSTIEKIENNFSLKQQLIEILRQDPRPAYKQKLSHDEKIYGVHFDRWEVKWQVSDNVLTVLSIVESK